MNCCVRLSAVVAALLEGSTKPDEMPLSDEAFSDNRAARAVAPDWDGYRALLKGLAMNDDADRALLAHAATCSTCRTTAEHPAGIIGAGARPARTSTTCAR